MGLNKLWAYKQYFAVAWKGLNSRFMSKIGPSHLASVDALRCKIEP